MQRPTIRISDDLHTAIVDGYAIHENISFNQAVKVLLMEALNERERKVNGNEVFDVATGKLIMAGI